MSCRLCTSVENLIDLFGSFRCFKLQVLRFYILLATGVQIREDDRVSKLVCSDCCKVVEKIYQYRVNSASNNFLLHQRLQPLESTKALQNGNKFIGNPITIKSTFSLHKSVEKLYKEYPNLLMPEGLYECNISPSIVLDATAAEEWIADVQSRQRDENVLSEQEDLSEFTISNIAIKEDVYEFNDDDDRNQMQPESYLGNIIIRRVQNCDNFEVINCIPEDTIPDVPTNMNCDNDVIVSETTNRNNNYDIGDRGNLQPTLLISKNANIGNVNTEKNTPIVCRKSKYNRKRNNLQYICKVCNKSLSSKWGLKNHNKIHLTCRYCKALQINIEALKFHENNRCFRKIIHNGPSIKKSKVSTTIKNPQNNFKNYYENKKLQKPNNVLKLKELADIACSTSSHTDSFRYLRPEYIPDDVQLQSSDNKRQLYFNNGITYPAKSSAPFQPNTVIDNNKWLPTQPTTACVRNNYHMSGGQFYPQSNDEQSVNPLPPYMPSDSPPFLAITMEEEIYQRMRYAQMFSLGVSVGINNAVNEFMDPPTTTIQIPHPYLPTAFENYNTTFENSIVYAPPPYTSLNTHYYPTLPLQDSFREDIIPNVQEWNVQ